MSACDPIVVHDITRAIFDCLRAKLSDVGVTIPSGTSGEISGMGLSGTFAWEEETETLTVTVTQKPFFLSCEMIDEQLRRAADRCKAG
jgi:hypothetical protein